MLPPIIRQKGLLECERNLVVRSTDGSCGGQALERPSNRFSASIIVVTESVVFQALTKLGSARSKGRRVI
jgi:hypothetical protein